MAGTKAGALKAKQAILARNPNHYKEIGMKGGRNSTTGGLAANRDLARLAGAKGGTISRRRRKGETDEEYQERTKAIKNGTKV